MSWFAFIASDFQFENVENTHIKRYSVNEALDKGITVPELVLNSEDIDRNKPNVLLWIDDEKNFGEISIEAIEKTSFESNFTSLKYCSRMIWHYSESRANQLIQYIQKHLEMADKVEIWQVWDGIIENESTYKKYKIQINQLAPEDFEKMTEYDFQCIEVVRS